MKLEYSLTNDDFLEHQLYEASISKRIKSKRFKMRIISPLIYLGFGLFSLFANNNYILAAVFLIIAILWFLFYPRRSKKRHIKHYKNHIKDHYKNRINKVAELEFNKDYILSKDSSSESKISTTEIISLIELKNHLFLKLNSGFSLIIPKRAIENVSDFKKEITQLNIPLVDELNWCFK